MAVLYFLTFLYLCRLNKPDRIRVGDTKAKESSSVMTEEEESIELDAMESLQRQNDEDQMIVYQKVESDVCYEEGDNQSNDSRREDTEGNTF